MIAERNVHSDEYGNIRCKLAIKYDNAASGCDLFVRHRELIREYYNERLVPVAEAQRGGRRRERPYVLTAMYRCCDSLPLTLEITVTLTSGTDVIYKLTERHVYARRGGELYYKGVEKGEKKRGKKRTKMPKKRSGR